MLILQFLALTLAAGTASAQLVFTDYTSAAGGTLGAATLSLGYSQGSGSVTTFDLSGPDFDPPGSVSTEVIEYQSGATLTLTLDQPVNLLLYGVFWRGTGVAGSSSYAFSTAPTIESGFAGAAVNGNSLDVVAGFSTGVLSFGNVSSLTITPSGGGASSQLATFASVPEPGAWAGVAGLLCLGFAGWRKLSLRKSNQAA